jgi:hypothetical protein
MKRARMISLTLGLLVPVLVRGAFECKPSGARNAAMGGISVAGGVDGWTGNPAHLLRPGSILIGVSLTPGMFELPELSLVRAMVVVPAGGSGFGCSFSRFGSDLYRETEGGLSCATGVAGGAALGASLRFFHLSIGGYGNASTAAIDLGLCMQPIPAFTVSLAMMNCTGSSLGACREEIPRSLGAAIEWSVEESLCMVIEVRKERGFPMAVLWGGEFNLTRSFSLRAGGTTEFRGVDAGAGIAWHAIRLDYAWRWHWSLGGTHTLSCTIEGLF